MGAGAYRGGVRLFERLWSRKHETRNHEKDHLGLFVVSWFRVFARRAVEPANGQLEIPPRELPVGYGAGDERGTAEHRYVEPDRRRPLQDRRAGEVIERRQPRERTNR